MNYSRFKLIGSPHRWHAGLVITVCAILLVFFVQMFGKAYRSGGYDFTSYLQSSEALLEGENPYRTSSPYPFVYTLFPCVYLIPLVYTPYWMANAFWFFLNLFALVYSLRKLHGNFLSGPSLKDSIMLMCMLFIVMLNIVQNNFLNGQINFLVLACSVLFFVSVQEDAVLKAAMLLAIAASTKLTPAIFFIYLLFSQKYKILILSIVFTVLLTVAVPFAIAGKTIFIYYGFYLTEILPQKTSLLNAVQSNVIVSLAGVLKILFDGNDDVLRLLAVPMVLGPIIFVQVHHAMNKEKQILIFSMYIMAILLLSPMSETHHLIFLMVPFVVIFELLKLRNDSSKKIFYLIGIFLSLTVGKFVPFIYFAVIVLTFATFYVCVLERRSSNLAVN